MAALKLVLHTGAGLGSFSDQLVNGELHLSRSLSPDSQLTIYSWMDRLQGRVGR